MTIAAKIIADSVSLDGIRITTLELRYPRFIHAEFMTHRVFSRNASSSRAIPVDRLIKDVREDTAAPIHWGKNEPGMQAHQEHDELVHMFDGQYGFQVSPQEAWTWARDNAINAARAFAAAGYHKQIVNRLLEPFAHINVIVTATDWFNFFNLRLHPDAQPEIRQLAIVMHEAMINSDPKARVFGEWHLPYVRPAEENLPLNHQQAISAARCARVSYKTHDGQIPDVQKDMELARKLRTSRHMSPFEHQATPSVQNFANLSKWRSFRSVIEQ